MGRVREGAGRRTPDSAQGGGGEPHCRALWMDRMRLPRPAALVMLATGLALLAGCDKSPESPDVPAQSYTSRINLIGKSAGSVKGQIAFPSAYSQRSAPFFVNGVQLATQPDGRFWVRGIPAGDHLLRIYVAGFEPIVRPLRVLAAQVTDAQALTLRPARGRIVGRIVTDDGRSAAGAVVRLDPYGLIGSADKDGIFQFLGIGAGEHLLGVQCVGCERGEWALRLEPNEARNLGIVTVHRRSDTAGEPDRALRAGSGG